MLQSGDPDVNVLLCWKLLFYCNFGWRLLRNRLSKLSDSNCILLSIMSTYITCIALSCLHSWSYLFLAPKLLCCCCWQPPLFFSKSVAFRCHVVFLISFDLLCLLPWFLFVPDHHYVCSCSYISMSCYCIFAYSFTPFYSAWK